MMMIDDDKRWWWWWCDCYDGFDFDDEVFCRRIVKTMMTMYGLWVCMHAFIDDDR